jgi:hypothetical protein
MIDRIRPDFSVGINLEGHDKKILMSPRYDSISAYRFLGHAIMRVIEEDGVLHIHVDIDTAERVSRATEIPLTEYDYICQKDYDTYLQTKLETLDDSWLEGEVEDGIPND